MFPSDHHYSVIVLSPSLSPFSLHALNYTKERAARPSSCLPFFIFSEFCLASFYGTRFYDNFADSVVSFEVEVVSLLLLSLLMSCQTAIYILVFLRPRGMIVPGLQTPISLSLSFSWGCFVDEEVSASIDRRRRKPQHTFQAKQFSSHTCMDYIYCCSIFTSGIYCEMQCKEFEERNDEEEWVSRNRVNEKQEVGLERFTDQKEQDNKHDRQSETWQITKRSIKNYQPL